MARYIITVSTPHGERKFVADYAGYDPGEDYTAGLIADQYDAAIDFLRGEQAQYLRHADTDQRPDPVEKFPDE